MKNGFNKAFTLIELLIVIAIIGIISSIVIQSLNNSRYKAYDAKVKEQLRNFRSSADLYYNNQNPIGYGPPTASCVAAGTLFTDNTAANGNPAAYFVFSGVNPSPTVYCGANDNQFAVKASLISGGGWCVDSNGSSRAISAVQLAAGSATICP